MIVAFTLFAINCLASLQIREYNQLIGINEWVECWQVRCTSIRLTISIDVEHFSSSIQYTVHNHPDKIRVVIQAQCQDLREEFTISLNPISI